MSIPPNSSDELSCRNHQQAHCLAFPLPGNEDDALSVQSLPPQVRDVLISLIQMLLKLLLSARALEVERQQVNSRNPDQAVPPEMAGEETVPEASGHADLPHQPAAAVPGREGVAFSHTGTVLPTSLEIFWNVGNILRDQGEERFACKDMVWNLGARGIELSATTLLNRLKAAHSFFLAYGWKVLKITQRKGITFLHPDAWTAYEEAERLLGNVTPFSPERRALRRLTISPDSGNLGTMT